MLSLTTLFLVSNAGSQLNGVIIAKKRVTLHLQSSLTHGAQEAKSFSIGAAIITKPDQVDKPTDIQCDFCRDQFS